jgi:hypothetical protein
MTTLTNSANDEYTNRALSFVLYKPTRNGTRYIPGTEATMHSLRWDDVCAVMARRKGTADKMQAPAFSPVSLSTPKRKNENVVALSMLVLDVDDGCTIEAFRDINSRHEFFLYSTYTHTPDQHRFRAIFPFVRDVPVADWARVYPAAVAQLARGLSDPSCREPARLYFLPSAPKENESIALAFRHSGAWLDAGELLAAHGETTTTHAPTSTGIERANPHAALGLGSNLGTGSVNLGADISEGGRNAGLTRVAGHFAADGISGDALYERVQAHNLASCKPPIDSAEVRTICRSISTREAAARKTAVSDLDAAILNLNSQFAWIQTPPAIWRLDAREFVPVAAFKIDLGNQLFHVGRTHVALGDAWLKSPNRRQHRRLAFEPTQGPITADGALNLWEGFAVAPAAGDVKPFTALVTHLFPHPRSRQWVTQWLAHCVQCPGGKKHSSLVIWSRHQGVGKNLLVEAVAKNLSVNNIHVELDLSKSHD